MTATCLTSPRRSVLSAGSAVLLATVAVALAACHGDASAPSVEWRYYPVQLHLHGSLSEGDGTLRGHNATARDLGTVEGLWWTDHDWRIAGYAHAPGFAFDSRVVEWSIPYRERAGETRRVEKVPITWEEHVGRRIETHEIRLETDAGPPERTALRIRGRSLPSAEGWQEVGVTLKSNGGRLHAPLAAGVEISVEVFPRPPAEGCTGPGDGDREIRIRLELSRQPEGMAELLYVVGGSGKARVEPQRDRRIGIVPLAADVGQWNRLVLFPSADAQTLGLGGLDNNLRALSLVVASRRGCEAGVLVDQLQIRRRRSGAEVLAWAEGRAPSLEEEFGLFNHVGLEVSYGVHMNVYVPRPELPDFERYPHGMPPADVVLWAHELGGVTSYNHVFGTNEGKGYGKRRRYVLNHRAFGADLLEVGYPHRVVPLEKHLEVWDQLSREQVVIGGIGTSDSHTQTQGWVDGNNYVTWVWSAGPGREQLIDGLRTRRLFFGDPVLFRGEVFLETADGIPMGQVVATSEAHREVVLRITGLPPGAEVRWIEDGQARQTLESGTGELLHTFRVVTDRYRFVRAEVWQAGRGLAFSNCLYFVPQGEPQ